MRKLLTLLVLSAAAGRAAMPLTYYQDWLPGPEFAGLYCAVDQGFYTRAGLDLHIHPFAFGSDALSLMNADPGSASIATLEGYILLQKLAKGSDLRVLTAVLQESPAGYMSLPGRHAASARDFVGLRIGVHKYGDAVYRLFLRRAGVDPASVTMVFVDEDVGRLQRGEVAFMQGYAFEELVQLRRRVGPNAGFIPFKDLGFDSYSQVVFATASQLRDHPGPLRAFIDATRAGWVYAIGHPDQAADSVVARMAPGTDRSLVRDMVLETAKWVSPQGASPLGPMEASKWRGMASACVDMGLMTQAPDPARFLAAVPAVTPVSPSAGR